MKKDRSAGAKRTERHYAEVSPALLRWARQTSGLKAAEAARKINVPLDRLTEWERGKRPPTVPQLRKAAHVYRRPLAAFFLESPPPIPPPLHDYRRLPNEEPIEDSPALLLEQRRARRRQSILAELYQEADRQPRPFNLRFNLSADPEREAERARTLLQVSLKDQFTWRNKYSALRGWQAALEKFDIVVFQARRVPTTEMRGFSVAADAIPVIVVNIKDSPRARVFTMMHELGHIALQRQGVCDPMQWRASALTADDRVEIFCNHVAGAILAPRDALLHHQIVESAINRTNWTDDEIRTLAEQFTLSREALVRRLLVLGKTTEGFYQRKRREYREAFKRFTEAQAKRRVSIPQPVLALAENGPAYTRLTIEALERGEITPVDASEYLGVAPKHLEGIAELIVAREGEVVGADL